jgi:hypothetical protein
MVDYKMFNTSNFRHNQAAKDVKTIGAGTESPDLILKTFPNKYSSHDKIP